MKYSGSESHEDREFQKIPMLACGHCKFFYHTSGEVSDTEERFGSCMRFPPQRIDEIDFDSENPHAYHYGFPKTWADAWCGEFQRKQLLPEWIDQEGAKFRFLTWECTTLCEPIDDVVTIVFGESCYDFPAWYVCEMIASGDIERISEDEAI